MRRLASLIPLLGLGLCAMAVAGSSPDKADLYFVSPNHGQVVSSPVRVVFGLNGMGVAPSGVQRDGTGHHHLLVNTTLKDMDKPIPSDAQHLHFGGGQTETQLDLPKGTHTLQLVLGNHAHIPHNPPVVSERITITVR